MNNQLLSVIVPCYNVAPFMHRCVESLIKQHYDNIEIILIDDGSIDDTPYLCNQYAKSDNRIRVFHQANKGSSATRAFGLKESMGDFVTFVDADDWIHPNMYTIMMQALMESNADIVQCGVCDTYVCGQQITYKHRITNEITSEYQVHDKISGVLKILEDTEWRSYMWNKIYKKYLFKNVQFPIGRALDDDLSVMHQIFHNAEHSIYIKSELYYYLHRQGSICTTNDNKAQAKKIIDRNTARWERYQFTLMHKEYHSKVLEMGNIVVSFGLQALRFVWKNQDLFDKQYIDTLKNRLLALSNVVEPMPQFFSVMKKVEWFLFRHCYPLYYHIAKRIK